MVDYKKISDVCTISKGKKVEITKNPSKNSIPYLLIDTLRGIPPEFFTTESKYLEAIESDILIVMDGANSGLVGTGVKGAVGSTIARLRTKDEINSDYLTYFLEYNFSNLNRNTKGSAIPHVKSKYLLNLEIRLPELEEQSLIVEAIEKELTRIESAVNSLNILKNKLKVYRQSVLKAAFEGKLIKLQDNLEYLNLTELVIKEKHSIKRGPFGGSLKKEIFVPKGYKIYEQKNAIRNNFDIGNYFISKEKFEEMKSFAIKPGDIIISCSGTIGKIAIAPNNIKEGIINQALLKITLDNNKILSTFFKYIFESQNIQKYLTKVSRGVAIKNVPSVKELKQIKFPISSIRDQEQILSEIESRFSVIDKIESIVDEGLLNAEKLKMSILKSAFEGKLVKGVKE